MPDPTTVTDPNTLLDQLVADADKIDPDRAAAKAAASRTHDAVQKLADAQIAAAKIVSDAQAEVDAAKAAEAQVDATLDADIDKVQADIAALRAPAPTAPNGTGATTNDPAPTAPAPTPDVVREPPIQG